MIRARLANGLRVLVDPLPGCARVAVSVAYGVGFRSEPEGRDGFAHLFEHLMFRGSHNLPRGSFHQHIYAAGGQAGGHTHQDHTEYFQTVPANVLEQALFSEADRMRAPVFTAASIAEQLAGVAEEIRGVTVGRPYGGLTWPLLPSVLYRTHANAHDGYGDVARLAGVTPVDCRAFFDTHYGPSNAVLTVAGGVNPDHVLGLVETHFGDVEDRQVASVDTREPLPDEDRWVTCGEPGVERAAVAMGLVLPDPLRDLTGYLAHRVLAALIPDHLGLPALWPVPDAACGFFEPLNARAPDTLVLVALLASGVGAGELVARVRDGFAALAEAPGLAAAVARASTALVTAHHRRHAEPEARARAVGRWELLFDRGELVDELPALLAATDPDDVGAAAAAAAVAPAGVVVMEPGPRSRPAPRPLTAAAAAAAASAGALDRRAWGGPLTRPLPLPGPLRPPVLTGLEYELQGSGQLVVLPDPRAVLTQLRVRWPVGHAGVADAAVAERLVAGVLDSAGCRPTIAAMGATLEIDTDGQWIDLRGDTPVARLRPWLDAIAPLLTAVVPGTGPAHPSRDPFLVGDAAWRRQLLACPPPSPPPTTLAQLAAPGATAVLVTASDPADVAAAVRGALGLRGFDQGTAGPPVPVSGRAGAVLSVAGPAGRPAHLTVYRVRPSVPIDDPGYYLATGLLGGWYGARLVAQAQRSGDWHAYCGRDAFLGAGRSYVRAVLSSARVAGVAVDIAAEITRLTTAPPGPNEIAAVRQYCSAQASSLADSPAVEADVLCRAVSTGTTPADVARLPGRLALATDDEVVAACADLFAHGPLSALLVGGDDAAAAGVEAALDQPKR